MFNVFFNFDFFLALGILPRANVFVNFWCSQLTSSLKQTCPTLEGESGGWLVSCDKLTWVCICLEPERWSQGDVKHYEVCNVSGTKTSGITAALLPQSELWTALEKVAQSKLPSFWNHIIWSQHGEVLLVEMLWDCICWQTLNMEFYKPGADQGLTCVIAVADFVDCCSAQNWWLILLSIPFFLEKALSFTCSQIIITDPSLGPELPQVNLSHCPSNFKTANDSWASSPSWPILYFAHSSIGLQYVQSSVQRENLEKSWKHDSLKLARPSQFLEPTINVQCCGHNLRVPRCIHLQRVETSHARTSFSFYLCIIWACFWMAFA